MLLGTAATLDTSQQWRAELKFDGCRGQLRVVDGEPALRTRPGRRCDVQFPEIITGARSLPDVVLDGEVVILAGDGTPTIRPSATGWAQAPPGPGQSPPALPPATAAMTLRNHALPGRQ